MKHNLFSLLAHPLTRGLDIDAPGTTLLRRQIVKTKPFLRNIYEEWYRQIARAIPAGAEPVLELGAGAGFMQDVVPNLITSEIFPVEGVDLTMDACAPWPFADQSLRGVAMTNVLHHLPQVRLFLQEATRCIKPGGVMAMIEPWNTAWARLVYQHLHHEPFDVGAVDWQFPSCGPLSGANGALPWLIWQRDLAQFQKEFPAWHLEQITPLMPLAYLLSGGVSLRALMPGWIYRVVRAIEKIGLDAHGGMFALLVLKKQAR
ncbi:MAG: methyltransferase domain-containing protein [bacterium]|nr:methyltransferase domain-containing protein [bacterium]